MTLDELGRQSFDYKLHLDSALIISALFQQPFFSVAAGLRFEQRLAKRQAPSCLPTSTTEIARINFTPTTKSTYTSNHDTSINHLSNPSLNQSVNRVIQSKPKCILAAPTASKIYILQACNLNNCTRKTHPLQTRNKPDAHAGPPTSIISGKRGVGNKMKGRRQGTNSRPASKTANQFT